MWRGLGVFAAACGSGVLGVDVGPVVPRGVLGGGSGALGGGAGSPLGWGVHWLGVSCPRLGGHGRPLGV